MAIQAVGMKAYANALANFAKAEQAARPVGAPKVQSDTPFAETLKTSLGKVNDLQKEKTASITAFASGENQNVHELMISLQKAGLAINMTAAMRNKVMEAYKELARIQF